VVKRLKNI